MTATTGGCGRHVLMTFQPNIRSHHGHTDRRPSSSGRPAAIKPTSRPPGYAWNSPRAPLIYLCRHPRRIGSRPVRPTATPQPHGIDHPVGHFMSDSKLSPRPSVAPRVPGRARTTHGGSYRHGACRESGARGDGLSDHEPYSKWCRTAGRRVGAVASLAVVQYGVIRCNIRAINAC